jgi:hypothetical protein
MTEVIENPEEHTEETETISVRGTPQTVVLFEKKRGKKTKALCRIPFDMTKANPFMEFGKAVGIENMHRVFVGALNELFDDAADEARTAEGKIDLKLFGERVPDQFTREAMKSKKDLQKQLRIVSIELVPLLEKKDTSVPLTPEEKMQCARLFAEFKELNAKLEKKNRVGRK